VRGCFAEKYIERPRRGIALVPAIGERAEAEPGHAAERTREDELPEHAVNAIERLVHILEHEDGAVESGGVRGAEERAEKGEVTTLERARRSAPPRKISTPSGSAATGIRPSRNT